MLSILTTRAAAGDAGVASTILTSQAPVAKWHTQIGDPTIADSILDRKVHHAYRIELDGENSGYQISFWRPAEAGGAEVLYTEDLNDGR